MAGIHFVDTVTHVPASWANAVNKLVYELLGAPNSIAAIQSVLGLDTMAHQSRGLVNIEGGNIDGVRIGANSPALSLVSNRASVLNDPVDAHDVVTRGWLQLWAANLIDESNTALLDGLGTMAVQNANNVNIVGGTINSVDIGGLGPASGRFTSLKVSNPPVDGDDAVPRGWLQATYDVQLNALRSMSRQEHTSVNIDGGDIDGVRIGTEVPVPMAVFAHASVGAAPVNALDIVNKQYLDGRFTTFSSTLGSMAYQNSNAVSITGGAVNGTTIGLATPAYGQFDALTVVKNSSVVNIKTTSTGSGNIASVRLLDTVNTMWSLTYYGNNNAGVANTVELTSGVPMSISHVSGAAIDLSSNLIVLTSPLVRVGAGSSSVVVGSGAVKSGYQLTVNSTAWMQRFAGARGHVETGTTVKHDTSFALTASGVMLLDVMTNGSAFVNLTGDATFAFPAADSSWVGLRTVKLILRQNVGGKLVTWPSNVLWGTGSAPDYTNTIAGDFDMVELWTPDGGTTWYGMSAYADNLVFDAAPVIVSFSAS